MFDQSAVVGKRIERLVGSSFKLNVIDDEFMTALQKSLMATYRDKLKENVYARMGKQAARDRFLDACGYRMTELDTKDEEMTSSKNRTRRILKVVPTYYSRDFKDLTVETEHRPYVEPEELKLLEASEAKFKEAIAKVLSERMSIYVRYKLPAIKYMDDDKTIEQLYEMADAIVWQREVPEELIPGVSQPKRQYISSEPIHVEPVVERAESVASSVAESSVSEMSSSEESSEEKEVEEVPVSEAQEPVTDVKQVRTSKEQAAELVKDVFAGKVEESQFDETAEEEEITHSIESMETFEGLENAEYYDEQISLSEEEQEIDVSLKETSVEELAESQEEVSELAFPIDATSVESENVTIEAESYKQDDTKEVQDQVATTPTSPKQVEEQVEEQVIESKTDKTEEYPSTSYKEEQMEQSFQPEEPLNIEEHVAEEETNQPQAEYSQSPEKSEVLQTVALESEKELKKEDSAEKVEQTTEEGEEEKHRDHGSEMNIEEIPEKETTVEQAAELSKDMPEDVYEEQVLAEQEVEDVRKSEALLEDTQTLPKIQKDEEFEVDETKVDVPEGEAKNEVSEGEMKDDVQDEENEKEISEPTSKIETIETPEDDTQQEDQTDDGITIGKDIQEDSVPEQFETTSTEHIPGETTSTEIDSNEHASHENVEDKPEQSPQDVVEEQNLNDTS